MNANLLFFSFGQINKKSEREHAHSYSHSQQGRSLSVWSLWQDLLSGKCQKGQIFLLIDTPTKLTFHLTEGQPKNTHAATRRHTAQTIRPRRSTKADKLEATASARTGTHCRWRGRGRWKWRSWWRQRKWSIRQRKPSVSGSGRCSSCLCHCRSRKRPSTVEPSEPNDARFAGWRHHYRRRGKSIAFFIPCHS